MSKIDELQEGLNALEDAMGEALEKARELYQMSKEYRCFGGQLRSYLIGTLEAFINNSNQSGSIAKLQEFLDDDEEGYSEEEDCDEDEE